MPWEAARGGIWLHREKNFSLPTFVETAGPCKKRGRSFRWLSNQSFAQSPWRTFFPNPCTHKSSSHRRLMASEKPQQSQSEGLFGGIISLFWNKKATPAAGTAPTTPADASKGQDYVAWADSVIKKSSELVVMLEDSSIPSSRLVSLMNDVDLILQADHDSTSVRTSSRF